MRLYKLLLTKNDCYKSGKPLKIAGLMLHSTGASNTKLSRQGKTMDDFRQAVKQEMEHPAKEDTDEMKVYKHTAEMPDWAQGTFRRLIDADIVKVDAKGEIAVQECSVQPMVYLDRLCCGKIERLPEALTALQK